MKTHKLVTAEADIVYDVYGPLPTADGRPVVHDRRTNSARLDQNALVARADSALLDQAARNDLESAVQAKSSPSGE